VLGLGGVVAFVFGSILLLDSDIPGFAISRTLIGGVGLIASLTLLAIMAMLVRVRGRRVVSGREGMIGEIGQALEDFERSGAVFVHGERWNAHARSPVRKGERLRVVAVDGLELTVEPIDGTASHAS
jgi:membrane-bound serine protease (ClpP class)